MVSFTIERHVTKWEADQLVEFLRDKLHVNCEVIARDAGMDGYSLRVHFEKESKDNGLILKGIDDFMGAVEIIRLLSGKHPIVVGPEFPTGEKQ